MKIKNSMQCVLVGIVTLAVVNTASSQIDYDGTALSYSQNFDSLGTATQPWTDNSTLSGWYLKASSSSFQNSGDPTNLVAASAGGVSTAEPYNIGTAGVNPVTDRALGWVVASTTGTSYIGLQLLNTSGSAFTGDVTLSYSIEQYSAKNTVSETVTTGYKLLVSTGNQLGSSGFTTLDTIPNPNLNGSPSAIDGNAPGNFSTETDVIDLSATPWNSGEYLWFQVAIPRESSGNNELLAIDDFTATITPVPEPSAMALTGLCLAGAVLMSGRRAWNK
jgi:PEP-CTERM motif